MTDDLVTLEGTVDRIRHTRDDSPWAVISVELEGSQLGNMNLATAVGDLGWVGVGEHIKMRGHWKSHATFGPQFIVAEAHAQLPYTTHGIERYLARGKAKGIGPKLAARLVDAFGPDTFDIIENHPERLTEVEGLGKKKAAKIVDTWQTQQNDRHIETVLLGWDISRAYIPRVRRQYGDQAPEMIRQNPYRLAHEVYGFGFKKADHVARQMGIQGDDPRRVQAGVLYTLAEAQKSGHLYLPLDTLLDKAGEALRVDLENIKNAIEELQQRNQTLHEPVPPDDDMPGHLAIYSRRAWEAETECAEQIHRLTQSSEAPLGARALAIADEVETALGIALAPAQREAIRKAFAHRLLVLTGGPGTGKTTLVRAICQMADKLDMQIMLAAPTGRAARRLGEATGHEAKTLHRSLEFSFQAGGFQRNEENPLEADLIVVDEASMIDIHLMRALVRAIPDTCRLILVGDVDQLPSVGPGDVLCDLIRSGEIPVCRLQMVFRQAETSAIVRNAHRVNAGQFPEQLKPQPGQLLDFYTLQAKDPEDLFAKIIKVVTERIPDAFNLDPIRDVQVIAPMHKGIAGCKNLNESLQEALNPSFGPQIELGHRTFRKGDRVMQIRNNYDKEVFNGDVGYITGLILDADDKPQGLHADMDGRAITYDRDELDELVLAYAVTAHKSQGSEYPAVVIPLATAHYVMLERNLLYTAMTRARQLVVLVAMKQALTRAVTNQSASTRHTRLAARPAHRLRSSPDNF